ncbi:MAG TPA: JAB domain-containing protein [Bacillota bacterium]|jgi:DNA repair protein RadC|nr:JAB domain-containing protein [Bacillota bacterium]
MLSINLYTLKQIRASRRRYMIEDCKITCPLACYKAIETLTDLSYSPDERFGIISLNTKCKLAGLHIIAIGNLNNIHIEPREIFKAALLNNASAIIAFHNHPSGEVEPSNADLDLTRRIQEAGRLMGISLLDHLIIGHEGYLSMRERGYII